MLISDSVITALEAIVGREHVRRDDESLLLYGTDGVKRGAPADLVVIPGSTREISRIARLCNERRIPLVARGAGTGYSGGAVPILGGIVLSLERLDRILEINEADMLAVVQPCVITGELQRAVERVGLFYPPDPASLAECSIGGNIAENAGGPRAFKYGTTKHYVLGLEAVLPTGEIIHAGRRTVKNVAGYDLTGIIIGSEGTLAVVTEIVLRLLPKPPMQMTIRATFADVGSSARAVSELLRARVVPSAMELIDGPSLAAVAGYLATRSLAPEGAGALLLIEVDGAAEQVSGEAERVEAACRAAGALDVMRAQDEAERFELWRARRELSPALKTILPVKVNNDVVVPKGRIPELFATINEISRTFGVLVPAFGHAGDGNIHVNIMVEDTPEARDRAAGAERRLFEEVIRLGGSITGEHGVGFTKKRYLGLQLSGDEIALMKRIKAAFDPNGILNPGKIFPE